MENKTKTTKIKNSSTATLDFPAIRTCDNKNLCKSLNFTHKRAPSKGLSTLQIEQSNTKKEGGRDKDLNTTTGAENINQNKTKAPVKKNTNLKSYTRKDKDQILKTTSRTKNKASGKVKTNQPIASKLQHLISALKRFFKTLITRTN